MNLRSSRLNVSDILYASVLLIVLCAYNLSFNFSYIPITEGWFSAYALAMGQGYHLYSDLNLNLTPLYPHLLSALTDFFGYKIIFLRIFGIFIIGSLGIVTYAILRAYFDRVASFLLSIFAIIYYQSGNAHITYDFIQIYTFWSLLVLFCIIKLGINKEANMQRTCYIMFLAGFFGACAFLTKQSNGIYTLLGSALCLFYYQSNYLKSLSYYLIGVSIPIGIILAIVAQDASIYQLYTQVFLDALEAKGGGGQILFNWISGLLGPVLREQLWVLLTIILAVGVFNYVEQKIKFFDKNIYVAKIIVWFILFMIGFHYFTQIYIGAFEKQSTIYYIGSVIHRYLIPINILFILASIVLRVSGFFSGWGVSIPVAIYLFLIVAGNGSSAGLSEISAFIGSALAFGFIFRSLNPRFLSDLAISLFVLVSAIYFVKNKFDSPYEWWGVNSVSLASAKTYISFGPFQGLYTDENTKELLQFSDQFFKGEESVYGFPNTVIPSLVNQTVRPPIIVQWFDFLNNKKALEECHRLKSNLPKKVMYVALPELAWSKHEELFRSGNSLGQRCSKDIFESNQYITIKMFVSGNSQIRFLKLK
jgi:hypothetical protein